MLAKVGRHYQTILANHSAYTISKCIRSVGGIAVSWINHVVLAVDVRSTIKLVLRLERCQVLFSVNRVHALECNNSRLIHSR